MPFFNIHNFGWTPDETKSVCERLQEELTKARKQPDRFVVFVLGDFNFGFAGKPGRRLPTYGADESIGKASIKEFSKLLSALFGYTLVTHDAYSHFNVSENILTDIDHFFVSWQGWRIQQMPIQATVSPPKRAEPAVSVIIAWFSIGIQIGHPKNETSCPSLLGSRKFLFLL